MSKFTIALTEVPENLSSSGPDLAKLIDGEVARFDSWMISNLGGGLSKFERAAVKTYLYAKLVGRIDNLDRKPLSPDLEEVK